MTFKKLTALAMTSALASTAAFAESHEDRSDWPESFTVGTASQGGTYFAYGSGWANLVAEELGLTGGGEVTGAFELTLTPSKFWLDGTMRYTLDGSEPTMDSARYDRPVRMSALKKALTIRARSYKGEEIDPSLDTVVKLFPEGGAPEKKAKKPAEPTPKY